MITPEQLQYEETMRKALIAQVNLAPSLYKAEADPITGRKAYADLDMQIAEQTLHGKSSEVDADGYVDLKGVSFNPQNFEQFATEDEAALAFAKTLGDRAYQIVKNGPSEATGGYKDGNAFSMHREGEWGDPDQIFRYFGHKTVPGYTPRGRLTEYIAQNQLGQKPIDDFYNIEVGIGDDKPFYSKDNVLIQGDPSADTYKEYVGKDKAGTLHKSGGVLGILGGTGEKSFIGEDGQAETRKAGYSKDGEFLGTAKFEQDILERAKTQQIKTEVSLADQYGKELTTAYRGSGDIQGALDNVKDLQKYESAITKPIESKDRSLMDIANQFKPKEITSPLGQKVKTPEDQTGAMYQDPSDSYSAPQPSKLDRADRNAYDSIAGKRDQMLEDIQNGYDYVTEEQANELYEEEMARFEKDNPDLLYKFQQEDNIAQGRQPDLYSEQNAKDAEAEGLVNLGRQRRDGVAQEGFPPSTITAPFLDTTAPQSNSDLTQQTGVQGVNTRGSIASAVAGSLDSSVKNTAEIADATYGNQTIADASQGSLGALYRKTDQAQGAVAQGLGDMGALRSGVTTDALSALNLGGKLSERESRRVTEDARIASTARGRSRDMSAILGEVNANEGARRERLNERRQYAQGALGQEGAFRQDEMGRQTQASMLNSQMSDSFYNRQAGLDQQYNQIQDSQQGRQLQASMANQGRDAQLAGLNLQASTANQGRDAQLAGLAMQAKQGNQQATNNFGARESQASMSNQQADLGIMQSNLQGDLANQRAQMELINIDQQAQAGNLQAEQNRQNLVFQGANLDYNRDIALEQWNQQNYQQGLGQERAYAQSRVGLEQATSADGLLAVTGRGSGAGVGSGQGVYGNSAVGLSSAPQLYNMAQGAQFMADQTAGANNFMANMYASDQQASAGIISGLAQGVGSAIGCWVAREIYGETNPQWLLFREYLFTDAPSWFRKLYLKFGERFAEFIANKPRLKSIIKKWMDSKIKGGK